MFASPGFVFLLLPVCAVLYYLAPNHQKPYALLLISAFVYFQIEPAAPAVLLVLCIDALCIALTRTRIKSKGAKTVMLCCIVKNLCVLLLFGILLPIADIRTAPAGLFSFLLAAVYCLTLYMREQLPTLRPATYLASNCFFARSSAGPLCDPGRLCEQIEHPSPSISMVGQGIMHIILGIAKQAILSQQLLLLAKTLGRLPATQVSLLSGWLSALAMALAVYFMLSGFGDIAVGVGELFCIELPKLTYYPLHSPTVRDYLYRMNLPLEYALGILLFGEFDREENNTKCYIVSMLLPFVIGLWLFPSYDALLWACYMAALVLLGGFVRRLLPLEAGLFSRIVVFAVTLPSYILLMSGTLSYKVTTLIAMLGVGGAPLYNDAVLYVASTNLLLLAVAAFAAVSLPETLSRITKQQFPVLWWIWSVGWSAAVMTVTTSFLLWNVR